MSDRPSSHRDPEQDAVRRLLADARVTEPMPPEVASRLDEVLAGLDPAEAVPRGGTHRDRAPVDLAAERRRRRNRKAGLALVAASFLVVGGTNLAEFAGFGSGGDEANVATNAGAGADEQADTQGRTESEAESVPSAEADASDLDELYGNDGEAAASGALGSGSLESDLVAFLAGDPTTVTASELRAAGCLPPVPGARYWVSLDGTPAVLVLGPAGEQGREAVVYACGASAPAVSLVLPQPLPTP